MTFAEPVEYLNDVGTALRECEPQCPKHLKDLVIQAADLIDDQQKRIEDLIDSQRLVRGFLAEWATQLEASTHVHIGQMDSASRAEEKTKAAQSVVLDVVRKMRAL